MIITRVHGTHDIAAAAAAIATGFAWAGRLYKLGSLSNQLTTDRALEHQVTSRQRRTHISGPLGGQNVCGEIQQITERFRVGDLIAFHPVDPLRPFVWPYIRSVPDRRSPTKLQPLS